MTFTFTFFFISLLTQSYTNNNSVYYIILTSNDFLSSGSLRRAIVFPAVAMARPVAVFVFYWISGLVTLVLKFSQPLARPHHRFVKVMHLERSCHVSEGANFSERHVRLYL